MNSLPLHSFDIETETQEEQREAGRWHPAAVVVWRGARHIIGAGTADDVDIFTEGGALYVIARNYSLEYAALEVFRDGERIADVFAEHEQAEHVNSLTPVYAAKLLANWGDCEGGHAAQ